MISGDIVSGSGCLQPSLVEIGGVPISHRLRFVAFSEDDDVAGADIPGRIEVPAPVDHARATEDPIGVPVAIVPEPD